MVAIALLYDAAGDRAETGGKKIANYALSALFWVAAIANALASMLGGAL